MSPVVARVLQLHGISPTAVVQAEYDGTYFVGDVTVEIRATDSDLVVGKEWVALLQAVTIASQLEQPRTRDVDTSLISFL